MFARLNKPLTASLTSTLRVVINLRFHSGHFAADRAVDLRLAPLQYGLREVVYQRLMDVRVGRVRLDALAFAGADLDRAFIQHGDVNRAGATEEAQSVLRLARGVCDCEHSLRPISEAQQGAGRIFHLALEQMISHQSSALCDAPEQVEQDFEPVTAEVEHWPAA